MKTVKTGCTATTGCFISCKRMSVLLYGALARSKCRIAGTQEPQQIHLSNCGNKHHHDTCMQVLEDVRAIIAEQLGTDLAKVAPDSKFVDLGADSLDTVEIMMALEEKFELQLDEEGAEKISTVQVQPQPPRAPVMPASVLSCHR